MGFPFDYEREDWTHADAIPKAMGVYAIFLDSVDEVPEEWRFDLMRDDRLLYIGKAETGLRGRLNQHFSGSTSGFNTFYRLLGFREFLRLSASDTFRKSIGSVLAVHLKLTPERAGNDWKWTRASEERLSQWLQKHCQYCYDFLPDPDYLEEFEKALIKTHKPPLNIQNNPEKLAALQQIRNKYRDEALGRKF